MRGWRREIIHLKARPGGAPTSFLSLHPSTSGSQPSYRQHTGGSSTSIWVTTLCTSTGALGRHHRGMGGTADGLSVAEGGASPCCKCPSLGFFAPQSLWKVGPRYGALIPCHYHSSMLSIVRPIPPPRVARCSFPIPTKQAPFRETWCDSSFHKIMNMVSIYSAVAGFATPHVHQH